MSEVTMTLAIFDQDALVGWSGWQTLWTKTVEMGFLPHEGDSVHVMLGIDEWWGATRVKRRYFNGDGSAFIELVPYQMCDPAHPNVLMADQIDGEYRSAWWTDVDGDPNEQLRRSGWSRD